MDVVEVRAELADPGVVDRTRTAVRLITGEERTEEVARMLSGAKLTETSRKHAEQMLKTNA